MSVGVDGSQNERTGRDVIRNLHRRPLLKTLIIAEWGRQQAVLTPSRLLNAPQPFQFRAGFLPRCDARAWFLSRVGRYLGCHSCYSFESRLSWLPLESKIFGDVFCRMFKQSVIYTLINGKEDSGIG